MTLLLLMPVAAYLMLQLPSMQTVAAKRAARMLSQNLHTEVSVEKVYFVFFNKLILGNVQIFSTPADTLINAHKLSVTFSHFNPFSPKASFQRVQLQGGVFHLEIEGEQTNLERVFKIQKRERDPSDTIPPPLMLSLTDFSLKDFRFTLKNKQKWREGAFPSVMDFADLDVAHIYLDVNNVCFERGILSCFVKSLLGEEKSGYTLNDLTGHVTVSRKETRIEKLLAHDAWSELRADYFCMHYNSARDFRHFVDNVGLEAYFDKTLLSFCSLSYYAPAIQNNRLTLSITGHVQGPVRYLTSNQLNISSASGSTTMDVDFRIRGLPSILTTTAFLDIKRLQSKAGDLAHILSQFNGEKNNQIDRFIPPHTTLALKGRLAGLLTNFAANATVTTDMGDMYFDTVLYVEKEEGVHINGHLETTDLHLENLMGKPFGALTMHTHTHAILRSAHKGGIEARIDSLRIHKIEINDYPFSHVFAVGYYENQRFDGRVVCSDPNLHFIFQGLANLNYREFQREQTARYDFHATVGYADLAAIGVDSRDSVSLFSGSVRANFHRNVGGDVVGSIVVQNADYTNSSGRYDLGSTHIDSHVRDSSYRFELSAPFAKATYTGSEGITTFVKDLRHHALGKHLPNYFTSESNEKHIRHYTLDATILDMLALGQLALPGLYIAPGTHLSASLTSNDLLSCTFRSKYIRYNDQKANNIAVNITGDTQTLHSTLSATELSTFGQLIDTTHLTLQAAQNKLDVHLNYANGTGENSGGEVNAHIFLGNDSGIAVQVKPSHLMINRAKWDIDSSTIMINPQKIHFGQLKLHHQSQSLTVNGTLDKERSDTLYFALNQLDISILNPFLKKSPYRFSGIFTGKGQVIDFYRNRQFSLDLQGTNIFVNEQEGGELSLACTWNHPMERFQISAHNVVRGKVPLVASGYYQPDNKYLNLNATVQNFSVAYFEPSLSSLISDFRGGISGNLNLSGPLSNLSLTSPRVTANNVAFTVNFTKVPYLLNGPILLHENGFTSQNTVLTDRSGNSGLVTGGMRYRHFKEISIDATVDFTNMHCLGTKEKDNNSFYGDVFATGRLHAAGTLKQIALDISARTEKNSVLHIPIARALDAKQSTMLTFTAPVAPAEKTGLDPFEAIQRKEKTKEPTQVTVALKADVTPDAALLIEINKATGDVISSTGAGTISIGVDPSKSQFDIFGDYTLVSGAYQFVLQGFISRQFFADPGGTITFNGDILKTNLNLAAAYRTKASISTLLADKNSVAGMREVECRIKMTGNMLNPNLEFDINIADLAPETRSRVDAAFTPEDKKLRQFMSLLVSGGFMPDLQSGILNNTSILYSNASEILSNQLNNIFEQLKFPLDVGFNYQPTGSGRDIFDVAISTQLFNNRVVVNGNVGNTQALGTTRDVAGNVDIEVKVTNNGNFRVQAFSRSADQYSSYFDLDNTQRNGVGVIYQEEFNTFHELFNKIFGRKKKRYESDPPVKATIATEP